MLHLCRCPGGEQRADQRAELLHPGGRSKCAAVERRASLRRTQLDQAVPASLIKLGRDRCGNLRGHPTNTLSRIQASCWARSCNRHVRTGTEACSLPFSMPGSGVSGLGHTPPAIPERVNSQCRPPIGVAASASPTTWLRSQSSRRQTSSKCFPKIRFQSDACTTTWQLNVLIDEAGHATHLEFVCKATRPGPW